MPTVVVPPGSPLALGGERQGCCCQRSPLGPPVDPEAGLRRHTRRRRSRLSPSREARSRRPVVVGRRRARPTVDPGGLLKRRPTGAKQKPAAHTRASRSEDGGCCDAVARGLLSHNEKGARSSHARLPGLCGAGRTCDECRPRPVESVVHASQPCYSHCSPLLLGLLAATAGCLMRPTDVGSDDGTTARAATAGRSAARGSRPGKKRKRPGPCCQARGPRWLRTGTARLEAGPERKERGGGTAVLPLGPRPNPSPGWSGRGRPAYPIRRAAARAAAMPGDRRRRQPPDSSSASALCLRGARGRALPQLPRLRPGSRVPAVASAAQRAARPGCCLCRAPGRASPLLPRPDPGPRAPPLLHRLRSGTRPCSCLGCAPGRAPPSCLSCARGPPRAPADPSPRQQRATLLQPWTDRRRPRLVAGPAQQHPGAQLPRTRMLLFC